MSWLLRWSKKMLKYFTFAKFLRSVRDQHNQDMESVVKDLVR